MIRVNVGLSRKLSRDYNSTGFSVNLDGEITAPVSDPEGVIEQVKELFDLAEEALTVQVDRSQSVDAIASHDESSRPQVAASHNGNGGNGSHDSRQGGTDQRLDKAQSSNGNGRNGNRPTSEPATNKQIQFLLNLGKQKRMSKLQLEGRVEDILGRKCDIYDLTKRDACVVLDTLTAGNGRRA